MNPNLHTKCLRVLCCLAVSLTVPASNIPGVADDSTTSTEKELVSKVIAAAGGEDKLLKLFRMEELYNAGKERVSPGTSRVSVVEPPNTWWIGTSERGQEPAKITAWAWTLRLTCISTRQHMNSSVWIGETTSIGSVSGRNMTERSTHRSVRCFEETLENRGSSMKSSALSV